MIKLMKADLYRLLRSKGMYISIGLMILYLTISILSQAQGSIGINTAETMNAISGDQQVTWTGMVTIRKMLGNILILEYFLLIYVVIISGSDFSMSTYKNVLSVGMSRQKYYISKLLLIACVSFLVGTLYYAYSFGLASLINGVGEGFTLGFFQETYIAIFLPQLLLIFAYISLAVMTLNITKSQSVAISLYLILPIVLIILFNVVPQLTFLSEYEMGAGLNMISSGLAEFSDTLKYLITAAAVIIGSTCIGILTLKRKDL